MGQNGPLPSLLSSWTSHDKIPFQYNRMVKVVRVITRLNIGGPAQHVVHLTALLPLRGFDSTLVCGKVDSVEGDMSDYALRYGVTPVVIPSLRNSNTILENLQACVALYRLFRRNQPEIVHLHLLKARTLGCIAARLARVPLVVETFHGTLFNGYYSSLGTRLLIILERWLVRRMQGIVAISSSVRDELVRWRVARQEGIAVIPLGLDLDRFVRRDLSRGRLRAELGIPQDAPLVGAVGRMVPVKGLHDLLEAASRVIHQHPRTVLVLVGDGPQRPFLARRVEALGLTGHVRFLGWRTDLERIYPDLDVVVLSSLHEGTPVSLIEAMAAGRPVVATRVGGVPDLIRDRETGLLVPPRDPAALAAAIQELLDDPGLRARLGAAAQPAVYPRFTVARLAEETAAYYGALIALHVGNREQKL